MFNVCDEIGSVLFCVAGVFFGGGAGDGGVCFT